MNTTMEPRRIQRKRTKGWRMPALAVYVGRPTIFGNPFSEDVYGHDGAVDKFRRLMTGNMSTQEMSESSRNDRWGGSISLVSVRHVILDSLHRLKGRTLCCWCAEGWSCHADVLLELANKPSSLA